MTRFHVIIPCAGTGSRMGAESPKQYLLLPGKPLIQHVVEVFEAADAISSIHIILSPEDITWLNENSHTKVQVHFCGGENRAHTVLNGLNAIKDQVSNEDWILVHDAARPGLSLPLLNQLITALEHDVIGGLLALPLADTLKRADDLQRVSATLPRNQLWQAQTPQMFRYATLVKALTNFDGVPTDEAQAIEAIGLKPQLVTGALQNLKVTFPQDLAVLSALLKQD